MRDGIKTVADSVAGSVEASTGYTGVANKIWGIVGLPVRMQEWVLHSAENHAAYASLLLVAFFFFFPTEILERILVL